MGAAISGLLLHMGDRLGLYKAMAGAGPMTSASLAARTGTTERYVREWLGNQAAGGYVTYDPARGTFELPAEQAMVLANEDSPVFLSGAFEAIASCYADHDRFVTRSAPAPESAGTSTTAGCSPACCGSSVPGTPPTWSASGSPRSTGWVEKLQAGGGASVATSAAGSRVHDHHGEASAIHLPRLGHARPGLQLFHHPVERGEPLADQVGGVPGTEEPQQRRRTAGRRARASRLRRRCGTRPRTGRGRRSRTRWPRRRRTGDRAVLVGEHQWPAQRAARRCRGPGS